MTANDANMAQGKVFTPTVFILLGVLVALAATICLFAAFSSRPPRVPMIADPFERCDLDLDGDCDFYDYEIVVSVIGECEDGDHFIQRADADHDGCVTEHDLQLLFPDSSSLPPILQEEITGEVPMTVIEPRKPCDLNLDGRCDATDFLLFTNRIGKCVGDTGYTVITDVDLDGCVTEHDRELLFPEDEDTTRERVRNLSPEEQRLERSPLVLCDFDGDGDCDTADFEFFLGTLNICQGDSGYYPPADVDGDGCVDSVDQKYLFPVIPRSREK